jgi:RNA polymerase sigma factor (sigma-70 family)
MNQLTDDKAFLAILDQHKRIIYKICNSYCREQESRKDLAQEITIQLWKSYRSYNPQFKLSTWLYRVALNVAISFYRRERKHHNTSSVGEKEEQFRDDDRSNGEADSTIDLLHRFISELDELHRALMILYLENNSYKDMSDVLGISETNVATKISRIKQKLKIRFETHNSASI